MSGVAKTPDLRKRIGERVRLFRLNRGLTQVGLADAVGIDETSLRAIEAGRRAPSLDVLARLAEELDVDPGSLLSDENTSSSAGADLASLFDRLPPKWRDVLLEHARAVAKAVRR